MSLRITAINIKNFKRVEAFEAKIDAASGLITIGGENANGKSSVLDAIYAALVGPDRRMTNPVREGADEAQIRVVLGNGSETTYKVVRRFYTNGQTGISVFNADGEIVQKGSELLREILSANAVDPVQFLGYEPKKQRDTLAKLVGLDLEANDERIRESRERQKELEGHQKALEARASEAPWHEGLPEAPLSATDVTAEIQRANQHNAQRAVLASQTSVARSDLAQADSAVNARAVERVNIEAEIARLQARLAQIDTELPMLAQTKLDAQRRLEAAEIAEREFKLIDVSELTAKLDAIGETNRKIEQNRFKLRADQEWRQAEEDVRLQREVVAKAEAEKRRALAEAAMPVDGLEFDSQQILYKGQPFSQASMAERVIVATGICAGLSGQCRPVFIRDASTLDRRALAALTKYAEEKGLQIIAEIVANQEEDGSFDRNCEFYIVDGKLYEPTQPQPVAQPQAQQEALL